MVEAINKRNPNVSQTRAQKAGLTMPPSRINRAMKSRSGLKRVGGTAPIYMAAVLEYITAEVLEVASNSTAGSKRKRVTPEDVSIALRSDPDLQKVCSGVALYTGDKLEEIAKSLAPSERVAPKAPEATKSKDNN